MQKIVNGIAILLAVALYAAPGVAATTVSGPTTGATATVRHRIVIQVDQNDPKVMNLALNNATNIIDYYRAKGEDVKVEVVAFGPGLNMLREDKSPVKERLKLLKDASFPSRIVFSACNNTRMAMEKREGHSIAIVPEAQIVPSGVVRVMNLEERGWSYVRP